MADENANSAAQPESAADQVSLGGLHSSIPLPPPNAGFFRQWRAFVGPALIVSVGYMDPGNWGTDLDAGASFKYDLLWVVALASFMAVIMQILSARLGIVMGKDLAQACRDCYPKWTRIPNWIAGELAIMACDLAEVLGSAVAINLLFDIPLFWAVIITAFDVLLLLALQGLGMRFLEAFILMLVLTIGVCYFIEIFVLPSIQPDFREMGRAMFSPGFRHGDKMIVLAIGIVGATVMPHNLYLHSALVQSRRLTGDELNIRRAIKFNTLDTVIALFLAFLVNAAILVLAALVFHGKDAVALASGEVVPLSAEADPNQRDPDWIRVAYLTLAPLLGTALASVLFGIALLASGQSSTITGTLAGQVVMEGFIRWKIRPWIRRLVTRLCAIVPAIVIIGIRGSSSVNDLLVLSQVVLAMQLPLAMFPLLHLTSSRKWMGKYRPGIILLAAAWISCLLITALDIYGLPGALREAWEIIVHPK